MSNSSFQQPFSKKNKLIISTPSVSGLIFVLWGWQGNKTYRYIGPAHFYCGWLWSLKGLNPSKDESILHPTGFKPAGMDTQNCRKKSCTSWYGRYPIIYRDLYIPGGAGFLPSTVWKELPLPIASDHFYYFHGVTSCHYPKCSNYRTCTYNLQIKSINNCNVITVLNPDFEICFFNKLSYWLLLPKFQSQM